MKNAIILAAGIGTRLRPYTNDRPKSLVEVQGVSFIERHIQHLREAGIKNITVIVGYLAEKFESLKKKYRVHLIYNEFYDCYNNVYSLYKARHLLGDTFIIEADTYYMENPYLDLIKQTDSTYVVAQRDTSDEEWVVAIDSSGIVSEITIRAPEISDYTLAGITYLSPTHSSVLNDLLEKAIKEQEFENLYWDDLLKENLSKLTITVYKLPLSTYFEVDTVDDYIKLDQYIKERRK